MSKSEVKAHSEELLDALKLVITDIEQEFPKNDPLVEKISMKLSDVSFWVGAFINKLKKEGV